jgi:paraquat-inducible protein B
MNNDLNPTLIGAFVVSAVTLLIFGILVFSSGKWFVEKQRYVIYFDESVNGLNIGAPVKLSGVPIGKVVDIKVRFYSKTNKVLTPVYIEIEPDKTVGISDQEQAMDAQQKLEFLIKSGLRMQLQLNSLLTGQLFIEALMRPETPVKLSQLNNSEIQELPSIKSSGAELQKFLFEALDEFQKLPLKSMFEDIRKLVQNLELITGSTEISTIVDNLNQTLENANELMANTNHLIKTLDSRSGPLLDEVKKTVVTIDATMIKTQATLNAIETVVGPDSSISQNLENTLDEVSKAARSGRLLLDYLERHPEALIKGKHPIGGE